MNKTNSTTVRIASKRDRNYTSYSSCIEWYQNITEKFLVYNTKLIKELTHSGLNNDTFY